MPDMPDGSPAAIPPAGGGSAISGAGGDGAGADGAGASGAGGGGGALRFAASDRRSSSFGGALAAGADGVVGAVLGRTTTGGGGGSGAAATSSLVSEKEGLRAAFLRAEGACSPLSLLAISLGDRPVSPNSERMIKSAKGTMMTAAKTNLRLQRASAGSADTERHANTSSKTPNSAMNALMMVGWKSNIVPCIPLSNRRPQRAFYRPRNRSS